MVINSNNNLIRIFVLPEKYPSAYCFGGGHEVIFTMVDWFNPYPTMSLPPIPGTEDTEDDISIKFKKLKPLYACPNGEIELTMELRETLNELLTHFIKQKKYSKNKNLLAITSYGDSFLIKGD